jgi:hypothetical protein
VKEAEETVGVRTNIKTKGPNTSASLYSIGVSDA